eukprot:266121-Alexandrium_andersonii.AAC.1
MNPRIPCLELGTPFWECKSTWGSETPVCLKLSRGREPASASSAPTDVQWRRTWFADICGC